MSRIGRHVGGLLLFLSFVAMPAQARVVPPEPFAASDDYALFAAQDDGYTRQARIKLKRPHGQPGGGELRGVAGYRYTGADGRQRFGTSVSAPLPAGILTDEPAAIPFDFTAEPIPPSAHRRVLRILHQATAAEEPRLLREYRAEQILLEAPAAGPFAPVPSPAPQNGTTIAGPFTFVRERGTPVDDLVTFTVADPGAACELRLTNGADDGTRRVASAVVTLNGEEVFSPSAFNQRVAGLSRRITLQSGDNQLKIRLHSAPGASVTLEVVRLDGQPCRAFGPRQFVRTSGKPKVETVAFPLGADLSGPFWLTVNSGNVKGAHRVDSVVVTLNGREILGPSAFNEQVEQLVVPVVLQTENILSVELRGKPGDFLVMEVGGYDQNPPGIVISQPVDGAMVSETPITVSGTVDDPLATVSVNGVQAMVAADGGFVVEGLALQEGDNQLTARAVDACGNQSESTLAVLLQTLPVGPALTLCAEPFREQTPQPPTETCHAQALGTYYGFLVGLVDETVLSLDLDGVLLPDGVEIAGQGPVFQGRREGNFFWAFINIPQVDGVHPFTATATNAAGESTKATVGFLRDTLSPAVTILTPDHGQVVNIASVTVTGTVDDPDAIVRLGSYGPQLPVVNGRFSATVNLPWDGSHTITISATDPSWNYVATGIRVIRDTAAPRLTFTTPGEGIFVNDPALPVTVTMLDSNPGTVTVAVNGGPAMSLSRNDDLFTGTVPLADGVNTIVAQGADWAGNPAPAVTRTVSLDRQLPTVAIVSPLPNAELEGVATVTVAAGDTLSRVASVALLAAGKTLATQTQPPFAFSLDSVTLPAGPQTLTVRARDRAGNMAEVELPVVVRPQLKVQIDTPLPGAILDRDEVVVWGTVARNIDQEVGVTVNGRIAHLQRQAFATLVPLPSGPNTLTVTATSAGGVTAQGTVDVTVTTTDESPRMTALPASGVLTTLPNGVEAFLPTLSVDVSLPGTIVNYAWDFTGYGRVEQEGPALATTPGYYFYPGLYFPTVTVTDNLGNVATAKGIVNVLDRAALDALLQAKWAGMKAALGSGDVEGALSWIIPGEQPRYRRAFSLLGASLQSIAGEMQPIELEYVKEDIAKYRIRREQVYQGELVTATYSIYFSKNSAGLWQIEQF